MYLVLMDRIGLDESLMIRTMRNGCDYDRVQKVTLYVAIYPFY